MLENKVFTLEEAEGVIPLLEIKLPKLMQIKKGMAQFLIALNKKGIKVEDLLSGPAGEEEVQIKNELEKMGKALNAAMADIQSYGCLIKDLDLGLIDFYGEWEGEPVFFCWQLGEKKITHYHGVNEGYSNRRPLFEDDSNDTMLH